ncbi:MAG: CapA family protein, partial [Myxococcota bacterium]|nr:CapA family protein [Myxococcota bacterium]
QTPGWTWVGRRRVMRQLSGGSSLYRMMSRSLKVLAVWVGLGSAVGWAQDVTISAEQSYEKGLERLRAKDTKNATLFLQACVNGAGEGTELGSDCLWELGWARWIDGDWAAVVEHWEASRPGRPDRADLGRFLAQAQDNLALQQRIEGTREQVDESFRTEVPEGTTVRFRAVGDLMIGTDFPDGYLPADQGAGAFAAVSDWLRDADLTFGNLEGPLCDGGKTTKCKPDSPVGSCYAFRTPTSYVSHFVDAGFDVLSTANNHAEDFGVECREQTEQVLDAQGVAHTGRPGDIASVTANGLRIAFIGFHTSRNSHYVNDHEGAVAVVQAMDRTHDLVVVSFHGGAEGRKALHVPRGSETYYGEDRGNLRVFARTVVDAGADMVLGHGPHVLRGMEIYEDRLIAYSLGNFATYGRFNLSGPLGIGAVLEVVVDAEGRFVTGQLFPTRQVGDGIAEPDETGEALGLVRMLSTEDFPETGVRVARDGTLARPGS